jgi:hypothetical protein
MQEKVSFKMDKDELVWFGGVVAGLISKKWQYIDRYDLKNKMALAALTEFYKRNSIKFTLPKPTNKLIFKASEALAFWNFSGLLPQNYLIIELRDLIQQTYLT